MVNYCIVSGCKREGYPGCGISFHGIPDDSERRASWLKAINYMKSKAPKCGYVCGLHFKDEDYITTARVRLKREAIPSVLPMTVLEPKLEPPEFCNIAHRRTSSEQRSAELLDYADSEFLEFKNEEFSTETPSQEVKHKEVSTQTEQIPTPKELKLHQDIKNLRRKLKRRNSKILKLKSTLKVF